MKAIRSISTAAAAALILLATGSATADEKPTGIGRQMLLNKPVDLPSPNIAAKVIRVTFEAGAKTPLHTHEGPGPRYVLKGRLKVEDHGVVQVYTPGDVFWEIGAEMTVENVGGSDAEMVIFEMAPRK